MFQLKNKKTFTSWETPQYPFYISKKQSLPSLTKSVEVLIYQYESIKREENVYFTLN